MNEKQRVLRAVCVISPNKRAYSETFIHAHIERLPGKVRFVYGNGEQGGVPCYQDDDRPLLSNSIWPHLIRAIIRRVLKLPPYYFEKKALKRFLLNNKLDAVLAEYGTTGVAVMEVCREAGVHLIVHFHGLDAYSRYVLERKGRRYPELFKEAAAIIAVSRDMENQLLRLGASREKLHYNPCGVDISLFQGGNPSLSPTVFVAVGRFVDKKAPHLTILAFKKVIETVPDARLLMIGDGPLLEACKQLSQAIDMKDAVEFLGPMSSMEVAAVMRQARAFVQHSIRVSYGDSEGTPVAVLEAGATGLPVVSTRHAGIQDVVIDGETGLLVDERDIDGMAEHMIRLARDPILAARLGKSARDRICSQFSIEKSINNLRQIIEESVQNQRGS